MFNRHIIPTYSESQSSISDLFSATFQATYKGLQYVKRHPFAALTFLLYFQSTLAQAESSVLTINCPNGADVEKKLNDNWKNGSWEGCEAPIGPSSYVNFDFTRNPLEDLSSDINMDSTCDPNPSVQLEKNAKLVARNFDSACGLRNIHHSYLACIYKIVNSTTQIHPGGINTDCFDNPQNDWWPDAGYFGLFSRLENSTRCDVKHNTFVCQRDIPRDPMSGIWEASDSLYPFVNFDNVENSLSYTIRIKAEDATCCTVQASGDAALIEKEFRGPYSFAARVNLSNIVIMDNATAICNSENLRFRAQYGMADVGLTLLDNNTLQLTSTTNQWNQFACDLPVTLHRAKKANINAKNPIKDTKTSNDSNWSATNIAAVAGGSVVALGTLFLAVKNRSSIYDKVRNQKRAEESLLANADTVELENSGNILKV